MSKNLLAMVAHLEVIASIKSSRIRNKVLQEFADNLKIYDALREIALNTIKGRVPLNDNQKKKLRKYKKVFLGLAKKTNSKKAKRQLVVQSGGFMSLLIPIITGLVSALSK